MSITMTVLKEGDECQFFADKFPKDAIKFGYAAGPMTFFRKAFFGTDAGIPTLSLPLEDAKKMAMEILAL